jgi:hypothetical protein
MINDTFVGECSIFMDQLKMGSGTKNGYTMLKETKTIGNLFIESRYTPKDEPDAPVEKPKEEEKAPEKPATIQDTTKPPMPNYPNPQGVATGGFGGQGYNQPTNYPPPQPQYPPQP